MVNKKTITRWALICCWFAIGTGAIVLLVAAIKKKDAQHCTGVIITIEGVDNNFFVDKKDILNIITSAIGGSPAGKAVSAFDLQKLETQLQKDIWVKKAQLFFDNNNRLMVKVLEREPLARIFTTTGTSFYIDSAISILPLSEKFSARLPVFTGFSSDKMVLAKVDSAMLRDILSISLAIQKDTFNMALIDQVDITSKHNFEMIPKIGNTVIVFGDATDLKDKFYKVQLFYREVMVKTGWNKYSEINVQYKGQIVAKRRGAEDKSSDSLRTLQLMQAIAENAERQTNDSLHMIAQDNENNTTNIDIVQQSIQRDDERGQDMGEKVQSQGRSLLVIPAVVKPAIAKVSNPKAIPVKKPVVTKPVIPAIKPRAVVTKPIVKPTVKTTTKPIIKATPANVATPKAVMPKPMAKPVTKNAKNDY